MLSQDIDCFMEGIGILIYPFGSQGIVYIRQAHYLSTDGNIVSGQPLRITAAVPAFMVVMADVVGITHIFRITHIAQRIQNTAACDRMHFSRGGLAGLPASPGGRADGSFSPPGGLVLRALHSSP